METAPGDLPGARIIDGEAVLPAATVGALNIRLTLIERLWPVRACLWVAQRARALL